MALTNVLKIPTEERVQVEEKKNKKSQKSTREQGVLING